MSNVRLGWEAIKWVFGSLWNFWISWGVIISTILLDGRGICGYQYDQDAGERDQWVQALNLQQQYIHLLLRQHHPSSKETDWPLDLSHWYLRNFDEGLLIKIHRRRWCLGLLSSPSRKYPALLPHCLRYICSEYPNLSHWKISSWTPRPMPNRSLIFQYLSPHTITHPLIT